MTKYPFCCFILVLLFFSFAYGQNLNILSFGGNNATTSTELVVLLEDLAQNSGGKMKIVSTREGIGYRKKSSYLIPQAADQVLDTKKLQELAGAVQKPERFTVFESSRAFMVLPGDIAKVFLELLKSKKNSVSRINSSSRLWSDLTNYGAGGASSEKLHRYDLKQPAPQGDVDWKIAPFMEYVVQFAERNYTVRVIPKSFGGLTRIINTLNSQTDSSSILVSTGNFLNDDLERHSLIESLFIKNRNAFVVANSVEVKNLGQTDLAASLKRLSEERVISINLCENEGKTCKDLFKPHASLNFNGLKVAVIGFTNPDVQGEIDKASATLPRLKNFRVREPDEIKLADHILKLHAEHDIVVLATNLDPPAVEKHIGDMVGIDFLIYASSRKYAWGEEGSALVRNFKSRFPLHPLQKLETSSISFTKASLQITQADIKIKTQRLILNQSKYSGKELNDVYPHDFVAGFYKKEFVLPDHRVLYPDKLLASKQEFAKMCARLLNDGFNAEVGICSIQNQNSTVIGDQDENGVRTWMRHRDFVKIVYLTGADLKGLRQRNSALKDEDRLMFVGLSDEDKIKGMTVKDNELYRVAMPKTVAMASQYKISTQYSEDTAVVLSDFIIGELKKQWAEYAKDAESKKRQVETYVRLYEGKEVKDEGGYWTHSLDKLAVEYSQLTTTDATAFSTVTDGRLKSVDQRYFAAILNYKASYNRYPFLNELGLDARYSKLELFPVNSASVVNILDDQIRVYGNIAAPIYTLENYHWLGRDYGPFFEVAYETEFEPDPPLPLQRKLDGLMGIKILNGDFIKSASAALMTNRYLTESATRNVFGFNLKLEAAKKVFGDQAEYKLFSEYSYYFDDDNAGADLRSRFVLDQSLNLNVVRKVTFGPYLRYFSLSRRSIDESLSQTIIGFNLTYSDFWKPKYGAP